MLLAIAAVVIECSVFTPRFAKEFGPLTGGPVPNLVITADGTYVLLTEDSLEKAKADGLTPAFLYGSCKETVDGVSRTVNFITSADLSKKA